MRLQNDNVASRASKDPIYFQTRVRVKTGPNGTGPGPDPGPEN